jgi:hypothetical protein
MVAKLPKDHLLVITRSIAQSGKEVFIINRKIRVVCL